VVELQLLRYNRPESLPNSVKKRKIRVITAFKVIQGHRGQYTNGKPVCDFLLVINCNWHPLVPFRSYCSLSFKFWTFCVFEPPFGEGGLGTTYDDHLWLIGKRVVDFLLVLIELFARCYGSVATSEKRSKISDFAPTRSFWSKISGTRGRHQPMIFAGIVRPMNALQPCRWQFSHKETL